MLRRDFMKALGVFGAAVAAPGAAVAKRALDNETPLELPTLAPKTPEPELEAPAAPALEQTPEPKYAPRRQTTHHGSQPIKITFDMDSGETVTVQAGDGRFEFTERIEPIFRYDRGALDRVEAGERSVDFHLEATFDWMQGDVKKALHSCHTFKMTIDLGEKEYICCDAYWTEMSYNNFDATFELNGTFFQMEKIINA